MALSLSISDSLSFSLTRPDFLGCFTNKGKNNFCGDGNCKKVTIAAFASGKILIHGAQSMEQIKEGYDFITNFIEENKSEVILR